MFNDFDKINRGVVSSSQFQRILNNLDLMPKNDLDLLTEYFKRI